MCTVVTILSRLVHMLTKMRSGEPHYELARVQGGATLGPEWGRPGADFNDTSDETIRN